MHPVHAVLAALLLAGGAQAALAAPSATPRYIATALADPARPAEQVRRDVLRKPGELIAFAAIKPGDRIAELVPASGYYTRIFSRVVGPSGRVYAFTPSEELRNCTAEETEGSRAMLHDARFSNVVQTAGPIETFATPEPVDLVWTSLNYHDLHDKFMGPANVAVVNQAIYAALKPGGVLLIVDHVAPAGSGLRDTETLHRIDPAAIKREVEAAGFVLERESNLLRNPSDDHSRPSFDASMHDRTDQVVLEFRRPK
jgi:predicted methyltransferase